MGGKSTRIGVYKCYQCRKQFSVKVNTVFEDSHVPMRLWLQAMYLLCSSKKGISSNQLHRTLGVTLKTAWFMSQRIREAMRTVGVVPMGGAGNVVEVDETLSAGSMARLKNAARPHRLSQRCAYARRTRRIGSQLPCGRNHESPTLSRSCAPTSRGNRA